MRVMAGMATTIGVVATDARADQGAGQQAGMPSSAARRTTACGRTRSFLPNSEFNGAGPLLKRLNNQGGPGIETHARPKWMTIRSDNNDKYAQPDGLWIGAKGTPTNVGFDGPELKGAENVVIAGIDHRETACGPLAFAAAYRFLTGRAPVVIAAAIESRVVLDGKLSGLGVDNKPGSGNVSRTIWHSPAPRWRSTPPTPPAASGSARRCTARRWVPTACGARWR
jgi:triacylglycerol lipase